MGKQRTPFISEALSVPALSHAVHVGGPDHEERNIGQSHQQVLAGARLPVGASPCRLKRGTEQSVETFRVQSEFASKPLATTNKPL